MFKEDLPVIENNQKGKISKKALAASAVAIMMVVAGCGSSSHKQPSASPTVGSSSTGAPITIGVLEPLSGGFAGPGQDGVNAVKLAAAEINASGGIKALGGRKLKVVSVDSTTDDATAAASAATQLLQSSPAFVVGPFVSAVALPASTVFERARVPECVGSFSDELTSRGYQYLFELPPTASTIAKAAVSSFTDVVSALAPNATKVAAVYDSNPGEAVVSSFAKDLAAAGKFQVVLNLQYPAGLTNAGPVAQKIQSSGAQVLVPGSTTPELEEILGSLNSLGEGQIPIFNPGGGAPATTEYVAGLKSLVNGQFVLPTWDYDMKLSPSQNALLAKINADYVKTYPSQPFMGQFAGEDYTCTQVMVAAMEKAKSADPTAIRDALVGSTFSSGPASLMPPGEVHFNASGLNDAAIPLVSEWCHGTLQVVAPSNLAATTPKSAAACGRSS
jgi:branched-chain amino acid transport system substrate-binding protein